MPTMDERWKARVEKEIIGLEGQEKSLEKILLNFKKTGAGGSCMLSGRRNSGKTLVLESILRSHFSDKIIRIERVDGLECTNFASSSKLFDQMGLASIVEAERIAEAQVPKILFIVDHMEQFALKQCQSFLYSILNGSQTYPWFVALIGVNENSANMLEKRVRSRLSKLRINFNVRFPFDTFCDGFYRLLNLTDIPKQTIKGLKNSTTSGKLLSDLYNRKNGFCHLKKLVLAFRDVHAKYKLQLDALTMLDYCFKALLPFNGKQHIMNDLPVRQLCLLNCITRLQEGGRCRVEFNYREIATEYTRFANDYERSMRVHDIVLFKDLDELVALGLLTVTKDVDLGQLQFKKVAMDVEHESVVKGANDREQGTPSKIQPWFR